MRRNRLLALLAILLTVSLVAAACGDDDDDASSGDDGSSSSDDSSGDDGSGDDGASDDGSGDDGSGDDGSGDDGSGDDGGELTTPSNPDEGVTDDVIKVGWMGDLTGPTASSQSFNSHGSEAYFDCLNERGGLLGRQIEYIPEDDQFGAEAASVNFAKLIDDDEILALVGMGNSAITTQLAPEVERLALPVIGPPQTIDAQMDGTQFFNNIAHYGDYADMAVAQIAADLGSIEDAVVMGFSLEVPSGQEYAAYVEDAVTAAGGTYVDTLFLAPGQTEATAQMVELGQAIENQGVNYLTVHGSPGTNLVAMQALADNGITDLYITGIHTMASNSVWIEGPADVMLDGQATGFHSFIPANNDIEAAAEMTRCAELAGYAGEELVINFAHGFLNAYIFEQAAIRAVEMSGELTRATLTDALRADTFDTMGISCEIDWTSSQHSPCGAAFVLDEATGGMSPVQPFDFYADQVDGIYGIDF